jgi:phosphotriesterase-related protein
MKRAMTVLGPVDADRLGHILPHEHIVMAFPTPAGPPRYPELLDRQVSIEILGKLRRDVWSCRDNLRLDDPALAAQEILSFRERGGGTIVDVTPVGLGRNVRAVREIARATAVNIIVGTGYYVADGHPPEVAQLSVRELNDRMVSEVQDGIEDTGIRAGLIGEIGVSTPMHPQEEKVLRAAARAHQETGAPLSVHQHGGGELIHIDALLAEEGVAPEQVILCHMCSVSAEQRAWAAGRGYYVEIDGFGNDYYTDAIAGVITRDPDRVRMVKALIERGHLRQVLASNDVALKMLLKRYGGWSYEHVIANIKPFMLREGIPPKAIDTMLCYNPMRAIAYLR